MGLVLPRWGFSFEVDNLTGTPNGSGTPGTNFTAGASGVDGTPVTLLSALAQDVHYLVIGFGGVSLSTADGSGNADILVDPAGGTSWSVLIQDLHCGFTSVPSTGGNSLSCWYHFPIYVKAGSSIGLRCNTAHTANITTGRCIIYAMGEPSRPELWWCGQGVEYRTGSLTPGTSGSYSSWTNIGAVTDRRWGAVQYGVNNSDATSATNGYYAQLGFGSQKLPSSPTTYFVCGTNEMGQRYGSLMPIFCDIPPSTQMQIRATCSGASPEAHTFGIWGVY